MKPIYFPFTYICEPLARRLCRLFGQMTVYLPLSDNIHINISQLQADDCIELRFPFPDDGDKLMGFSRELKAWGEQHYGDGASLKNAFNEGFYNQTFTAQIRADILKLEKPVEATSDPVFNARLFLLMAQELDAQQDDLDRKLSLSADAEQELFARMKGQEKPDLFEKQLQRTDYGSVMTASRLSAWSHLFCKDAPESCFLVTTSRACLDHMMESFPDIRQASVFDNISWDISDSERAALIQYLSALSQASNAGVDSILTPILTSSETAEQLRLTLYFQPGTGPAKICSVLSHAGDSGQIRDRARQNTIIALCEA
jgi:hypothetical protein